MDTIINVAINNDHGARAAAREREIELALDLAAHAPGSVALNCAYRMRAAGLIRRVLESVGHVERGTITRDEFAEEILDLAREERRRYADEIIAANSRGLLGAA
jgi:hypothetical protein